MSWTGKPERHGDRNRTDDPVDQADSLQWSRDSRGRYRACGTTRSRLPAGAYEPVCDMHKGIVFEARELWLDDLIDFPDSVSNRILEEIDRFWSLGERFRTYGFLHRRGYLLYGKQGCGKSSLVHQLASRIAAQGNVIFFCTAPSTFISAMTEFREIEPHRPIVCVFEDIDKMIGYGDSALLQWLDGNCQVDKAVSIATTNYPERLERRLVARPRRFDRVLHIESPDERIRRSFFRQKLSDVPASELDHWVERSDGLTFAAMAELIISVKCLEHDLTEVAETLQQLDCRKASSDEFESMEDCDFIESDVDPIPF